MAGDFIDTNILLYVVADDSTKAARAEQVVRQGGSIRVQVLNEAASVARRKMGLTWAETRAFLSLIRTLLPVRALTTETHDIGLALAERYNLSIYDALIAASALEADCDRLWSEDMQDGLRIDGRLRIVNPFLDKAQTEPAR
jgi:predicted nucleic acid-binding protein